MNNASIHHVQNVSHLIETQAGVKIHCLPPYSPVNAAEGVFNQVKSIRKQNHKLFKLALDPEPRHLFLEWLADKIAWDTYVIVVTYNTVIHCSVTHVYFMVSYIELELIDQLLSKNNVIGSLICVEYPLLLAFPMYAILKADLIPLNSSVQLYSYW